MEKTKPPIRVARIYVVELYVTASERATAVRLARSQQAAERMGVEARAGGALVIYCGRADRLGRVLSDWLRGRTPQGAR